MISGAYAPVPGTNAVCMRNLSSAIEAGGRSSQCQNFQTRFSCRVSNDGVPVAFSKSTQRIR